MKRMLLRAAALVVALTGVGVAPGCGQGTSAPEASGSSGTVVRLQTRFSPGEKTYFSHTDVTRQGQLSSTYSIVREIVETRCFSLETLEAEPDGVARMRLVMERIATVVRDGGNVVFLYDSDRDEPATSDEGRAREVLSGLEAEFTIAPRGTVLSMRANLMPEDLAGLPANLQSLLAENWFRAAIEAIYKPFGDRVELDTETGWTLSGSPGAPFAGDEYLMETAFRVTSSTEAFAEVQAESTLYRSGEPVREVYASGSTWRWSHEAGRLERFLSREKVRVEERVSGIDTVQVAEREISMIVVDSSCSADDKGLRDRPAVGGQGAAGDDSGTEGSAPLEPGGG